MFNFFKIIIVILIFTSFMNEKNGISITFFLILYFILQRNNDQ